MKPASATFLGSFLVVLALVAVVVGVVQTRPTSGTHRAAAIIHVLPKIETGTPIGTEVQTVLKTEADLVRSEIILSPVVEKLDLNNAWGKRYNAGQKLKTMESCEIAKKRLNLETLPNSALIQIEITGDDAEEAVKIANAVAEAYCDYRVDRRRRIEETTASNLVEMCREPLAKVTAARTNLDAVQMALASEIRANPPPVPTGENKTLRAAQSRHTKATVEVMTRSTQLATATKSATPDTNLIAALTTHLERFQQELAAAANEVNAESQKVERLKEYWQARARVEMAEKIYAPFKKAADDARAENLNSEKSLAVIQSRAEQATLVNTRDLSRGKISFGVGAVLLLAGAGLLASIRTAPKADNQKGA